MALSASSSDAGMEGTAEEIDIHVKELRKMKQLLNGILLSSVAAWFLLKGHGVREL